MRDVRPPLDRSAAAIGLVTVVAANFLSLAGLPLILDPMISMEPFYIQMAQRPLLNILSEDPAWGPLYAVWLKPFVAALGDPVTVYTANLYGLSVGVSVLIYLYVLLLTRRAAVGVGAALFFLVCDFNVPLSSKVSGFALMIVLAGLAVSELLPAGARRMSVAAAGVLLASYARPELYPAALCLCLAAVWCARTELGESGRLSDLAARSDQRERAIETTPAAGPGWSVLLWPATGLASISILAFWVGTPLFSPYHSSGRLLTAFREHFAWNWSRWHNESPDFFSIWEHEFGGAQTTLQALRNNPGAVAHHLIDNLLGTVNLMATTAFNHYPLLVPATSPDLVKAESLLVSAAVFGSLILVACRQRLRRQMFDSYGHALFPYAALAICSVASATAVFPLVHYLVIPGVLLMLAGTLAATLIIPACPDLSWYKQGLAALVCLAAVPKPYILPSAYVVPGSAFKARITVARTIADTIGFIRSLKLPAPVQVLTFTDGIGEMLGTGFHEVKIWQKGAQPLEAYMRDNDVGVIVSLGPGQESFMDNDPDWKRIQNSPDAAGFARLSVPNHEAVAVLVRRDLMQR
jgi:hypothetical protein